VAPGGWPRRRRCRASRLPRLEAALSQELIPAKQEIVRDFVADEMRDIIGAAQALLAALEDYQGRNRRVGGVETPA
jgi:hypothetical protein